MITMKTNMIQINQKNNPITTIMIKQMMKRIKKYDTDKPEEQPNNNNNDQNDDEKDKEIDLNDYDFINNLKYNEDDVENGLFSFLGSDDLSIFTNPVDSGIVNVECSPLKSGGLPSMFISLKHESAYCITYAKSKENPPYFTVNTKDKYIIPTHYSLKNYSNGASWWIKGWSLEGSNDNGITWNTFDLIKGSDDLKGK
eukprot:1451_1